MCCVINVRHSVNDMHTCALLKCACSLDLAFTFCLFVTFEVQQIVFPVIFVVILLGFVVSGFQYQAKRLHGCTEEHA